MVVFVTADDGSCAGCGITGCEVERFSMGKNFLKQKIVLNRAVLLRSDSISILFSSVVSANKDIISDYLGTR